MKVLLNRLLSFEFKEELLSTQYRIKVMANSVYFSGFSQNFIGRI